MEINIKGSKFGALKSNTNLLGSLETNNSCIFISA